MRRTILPALVSVALLSGCLAGGQLQYRATVSTPDLVTVSPGIQVIADYDEPIFYTGGFYWRHYDNVWYRSNAYTGGWSYVDSPPVTIARIERPTIYAHYRPSGYVARNRPVPARQLRQPDVRDHRTFTRPARDNRHDSDRDKDHDKDHSNYDRDHR